jgi:hypothetical protein
MRLKEEGHKILAGKRKKPPRVEDFEKALAWVKGRIP